jgi:hypothetical protein
MQMGHGFHWTFSGLRPGMAYAALRHSVPEQQKLDQQEIAEVKRSRLIYSGLVICRTNQPCHLLMLFMTISRQEHSFQQSGEQWLVLSCQDGRTIRPLEAASQNTFCFLLYGILFLKKCNYSVNKRQWKSGNVGPRTLSLTNNGLCRCQCIVKLVRPNNPFQFSQTFTGTSSDRHIVK